MALFALLGFTLVPLGRKTALEHAREIFTTPAALSAWHELGGAAARLRDKLQGVLMPAMAPENEPDRAAGTAPEPELPPLPRHHHENSE